MIYKIDTEARNACVSALIDQLSDAQYWLLTDHQQNDHPRVITAARTFIAGARALTELKHGVPESLRGYEEATAIIDAANHAKER